MNIYLVKRTTSIGYDEFDEFVVSANNEQEARRTHPRYPHVKVATIPRYITEWPDTPESLDVTFLGSSIFSEVTVHSASFNAG